jgi:hypothetical protein
MTTRNYENEGVYSSKNSCIHPKRRNCARSFKSHFEKRNSPMIMTLCETEQTLGRNPAESLKSKKSAVTARLCDAKRRRS